MNLVIVLVLLVVGSLLFHWWSPWWFTPLASNWGTIDTTIDVTFVITGIVFVAVNLFMAYAIYRFRHNPSRRRSFPCTINTRPSPSPTHSTCSSFSTVFVRAFFTGSTDGSSHTHQSATGHDPHAGDRTVHTRCPSSISAELKTRPAPAPATSSSTFSDRS